MRARSLLASVLLTTAMSGSACSQTPVVVPLRSMERPRDVDFICLEDTGHGTWKGVSLEKCAANFDGTAVNAGSFRLHAVVTQVSRGELAVVDLGRLPGDDATLTKADPRIPGYSFIPVGAVPTDVVADPMGTAVFVASGRDPRIDVLPASLMRGPIDTKASAVDPPPWPHIDFDRANDGVPNAMAIVRDGDSRRLYVTLPDAQPSAKIAVFDLTASALVPSRIGDIALTAPAPAPLVVHTPGCGPTGAGLPWWAAITQTCAGKDPPLPGGSVTVDTTMADFRLAGVTAVSDKLFVADDHAPVIHVYDVKGGAGLEIRQIAIGAKTSRVAVSPAVPDEVTLQNSAAIETCVARGWVGDGLDHSADSVAIRDSLKGRCRAHRYLYAIDLVNSDAGNGSIAIVDLPVTYALDDKNQIKLRESGVPAEERIDIDGAELVEPMACDAPSFPPRRLPLGPFGVGGVNAVPARSIAFIEVDPPKTAGQKSKAVRCRPFKTTNPDKQVTNVHPLGSPEYEGVPDDVRAERVAVGGAWATDGGIGPRRLRGVFAWVALSNGALSVVDIDDYDSICRGPKTAAARGSVLRNPDEPPSGIGLGDEATDEYYPFSVRRHHPRAGRAFDSNLVPAAGGVVLSRFDTVISNDLSSSQGRTYPHFVALGGPDPDTLRVPLVLASPDNPYSITTETWTVTYEGALPGFTGAFGALGDSGGRLVLSDPSPGFCRRGVESDGPDVSAHDSVQLLDELCQFGSCSPSVASECLAEFGEATRQPLLATRSLVIEKAHEDRLVLANKHYERFEAPNQPVTYPLVDGPPKLDSIKKCFGSGLLRYTVRSSRSWVVVGSASGFLHRKIVDPASTDKACINDVTRPAIYNGRTGELPPLPVASFKLTNPLEAATSLVTKDCQLFINPSWKFAIRQGASCDEQLTQCNPSASQQDQRFTFVGRFAWQPFTLAAGQLAASMRPIATYWDGREHLNWNMIAVVDAIDRGFLAFPAFDPFSFQKAAN